jgi:hypothetical protein
VKKILEEIGIPELTDEQLKKLCEVGEKAARDHIFSRLSVRRISTLDITLDTEGNKPVTVNVEVHLPVPPSIKDFDVNMLAQEATERAFEAIKGYLRELACKSAK